MLSHEDARWPIPVHCPEDAWWSVPMQRYAPVNVSTNNERRSGMHGRTPGRKQYGTLTLRPFSIL